MNVLPHLTSWNFALAGMLCACGPLVIHMLNRRRFRRVHWAAMDFLLEAFRRERRILRIRDWLLMLLRTVAVLFFGLALARPFFSQSGQVINADTPRHAILLMDNSLSMAYRTLDGTVLERAKRAARQLIDSLPAGSRITVLPTCGDIRGNRGAFRSVADAGEVLQAIDVVDRAAAVDECLRVAAESLGAAFPLPDQIFLFTDLQQGNWPRELGEDLLGPLPSLQVCDLSLSEYDNTWVADVRIRDGVADMTTPATILVVLERRGGEPRRMQVTLAVDQAIRSTRTIEMSAGHTIRELSFEHTFSDVDVHPGQAANVPVCVSISEDRLPQDDQRTLIVPVVAALPVVFVDQYDEQQEDVRRGKLGETRHIRQLLAPSRRHIDERRPLIDVRHVSLEDVNRWLLAPARLVVVAGVRDPGRSVPLLREYVEQGGPLVIAAGGGFEPTAWTSSAWRDGDGLLPAPLAARPIGVLPDEAVGDIEPFFLSYASMASHPFFQLAGLSDTELRDLYSEPMFFKAVEFQIDAASQQQLALSEQRRASREASDARKTEGRASEWLLWQSPRQHSAGTLDDQGRDPVEARTDAERGKALVCARYGNVGESAFLVERKIGKGRVIAVSTGILSEWNTLAQTNAVVIWDHILRGLIRDTLPRRNYLPQAQIALSVPPRDRRLQVRLERPAARATEEFVDVGYIDRDEIGVVVRDAWTRGVYRLSAVTRDGPGRGIAGDPGWTAAIAVNGEVGESYLRTLSGQQKEALHDLARASLVTGEQLLRSDVGVTDSRPLWRWLLLLVFVVLFAELGILIYPWLRTAGWVSTGADVNGRQ